MDLIWLAVIFPVLARVFYIFGVRGIAGFSMEIAKILVIIFVIIAILTFLSGALSTEFEKRVELHTFLFKSIIFLGNTH
jgi:uncharacterized membrane protein YtjA (UPF0391 family)